MVRRREDGQGSISQRKDGRWEGRYWVETPSGSRRKVVYGSSRKDIAGKLTKAIANAQGRSMEDPELTVGDYLNQWLEDSVRGSVKDQTYESYKTVVRLHLSPSLGHKKIVLLRPVQIQRLYKEKLDSGLSRRSVEYIHAVLNRAMKQAVRWEILPRNVCEAVDPPHPSRREINPLDLQQTRRLLSCARQTDLEALYLLAVTAGLRQGELLGLAWKDVDLEKGLLKVRRTLITRAGGPRFDQPKTKKSQRTITLTPEAVSALKRHQQRKGRATSEEDLVFCTRSGRPISPQNLTKQSFRPLLKKAGLPSIRFHDLRHTCATLLLAKGVHPRVVQDLLGHASVTLTLDTYSHVLPEMGNLVAQAMKEVLGEE